MTANVELIQGAYAAFGRGDIPAVIGMLDDAVDWSSPKTLPHGGHFVGKDGVGQFFQGLGAAWSGLDLTVESVSEAGPETVVGVVRADGNRQDGRASGYGATHLFTIRSGKVAMFREYTDLDSPLT